MQVGAEIGPVGGDGGERERRGKQWNKGVRRMQITTGKGVGKKRERSERDWM